MWFRAITPFLPGKHVERDAYMDPDFLGRYEDSGKAVHVDEDGHVSLQLEVIPDLDASP